MQRSEDLRIVHLSEEVSNTDAVAHTPLSTLAPVDPLYTPLLDAIALIRQQIDSQHQTELEALKRSTANQTEALYHRLSEAREHFVALERDFEIKIAELADANQKIEQQTVILTSQAQQLASLEAQQHQHHLELAEINEKHELLLTKLKAKIDSIQQDYQQQLDNLQSKLDYQKLHHEEQMQLISQENLNLTHELHNTRREYLELHSQSQGSRDVIAQLQQDIQQGQLQLKEKTEKLLRSEHGLKLAHEELERNQRYVRELEEKNNAIQKELFENWIHKKEEL